jgi:pSer/pThr/pTyr-binding forkhead associated (FHA) protein
MERKSEDAPLLVAQNGPLNGQRWAIRGNMVLGREPTCDIVIADRQVSRHHASITITPKGVLLEDLNSKNGTHRNGALIDKPIFLEDSDILQVALAQQFIFLSSDATLPLESDGLTVQPPEASLLVLDKRSRRVWISGEEVLPPLSVSQFSLLEILYEHQGRVVPRADLIRKIWDEDQAVGISEQAFDALVRRLRDRLKLIDAKHQYIVTVRGHGLRLDNPPKTG